MEERRRHVTTLSDAGHHHEAGLAASDLAYEVVVGAHDDEDNLLWYYIYPENAPERYIPWKAFSNSPKLMYGRLYHSVHCSILFLKVRIWSAHLIPGRNPACSFSGLWSIASEIRVLMIFARILHATDMSVIPPRLLQLLNSPFF